jgi:hypothetical protein
MNFSSPSRLGWCLRSNSITLSIAARLGSDHQLTCSKPAVHQYPLLAETGFPRGFPQADFARQGHRAESQVPGAALYSHWRPGAGAPV